MNECGGEGFAMRTAEVFAAAIDRTWQVDKHTEEIDSALRLYEKTSRCVQSSEITSLVVHLRERGDSDSERLTLAP